MKFIKEKCKVLHLERKSPWQWCRLGTGWLGSSSVRKALASWRQWAQHKPAASPWQERRVGRRGSPAYCWFLPQSFFYHHLIPAGPAGIFLMYTCLLSQSVWGLHNASVGFPVCTEGNKPESLWQWFWNYCFAKVMMEWYIWTLLSLMCCTTIKQKRKVMLKVGCLHHHYRWDSWCWNYHILISKDIDTHYTLITPCSTN